MLNPLAQTSTWAVLSALAISSIAQPLAAAESLLPNSQVLSSQTAGDRIGNLAQVVPQQLAYGYRGSRLSWRVYPRPSRYRIGGFARSSHCLAGQSEATALVPPPTPAEDIQPDAAAVNSTLESHPVFWLHVPETQPTQAFFTLQKADAKAETDLYSTTISLSGQAGIIGIRLPESAPGLAQGESYLWQVLIQCEADSLANALHLGSWIERLDPEQLPMQTQLSGSALMEQLRRSPPQQRALHYADLGIWQDTLSTLAQLRHLNPSDTQVQNDWAALLNATQMQPFIQSPVLQIY